MEYFVIERQQHVSLILGDWLSMKVEAMWNGWRSGSHGVTPLFLSLFPSPSLRFAAIAFRTGAPQQHNFPCDAGSTNFSPVASIANITSKKRGRRCAAAQEGVPQELFEDSKFVPIKDDDPRFGPPAMLHLGFRHEEIIKIRGFLKEIEAEFINVLLCTQEMITGTLWDAFNSKQEFLHNVKVPERLPRICFLSGLTGEEIMLLVDRFPETGLESTIFAALVPNNASKPLEELLAEILDDHARLTASSRQ